MKTYLMNTNTGSIFDRDEVSDNTDMVEVIEIGGVWMDDSINPERLQQAIEYVEANNRQNGGSWAEWDDASDILNAYTDGKGCDWVRHILDRAIESDGDTLIEDLPKVEFLVWGQNFSGSF